MSTIYSSLLLENVDTERVKASLKHLKEIEDIPYQSLDIKIISDSSLDLRIEYPLNIFDKSVSQFMAVLFGELAFMRSFGKLTFTNLEIPEEVYSWFGGPKFGHEEVMKRFGVKESPMLVAIIKPSLGENLRINDIEEKIEGALAGGFHAVKDDEMQGDLLFAPLQDRLQLAKKIVRYIPALNLDSNDAYERALSDAKIGMVIINASTLGFPMLHSIKSRSNVPIFSHNAMQGTFQYSFRPKVFAFLHRLFGCDAFLNPIGDVDYYRISVAEEHEMALEFTRDLPIKKTLPLLGGGARLHNLEQIMPFYEENSIPYGLVFGTLIFVSEQPPKEMARLVVERVKEIKENISK